MSDSAPKPFTRADFERAPSRKLLREGRAANAVVSRVEVNGKLWTVKDFKTRSWFVRRIIAPFLFRRELAFIERLKGNDGIADAAFRIERDAIAIVFVPGRPFGNVPRPEITPAYLETLERLVEQMHQRGVVHLDLRGTWNILVRPDYTPGLIDFQSSLFTDRLPAWLKKLLEDFDRSGVLKKWRQCQRSVMGEARYAELQRINRLRRFWVFRGYFGLKKKKKKKPQ